MKHCKQKRMTPRIYHSIFFNNLCAAKCAAIRARTSHAVQPVGRQLRLLVSTTLKQEEDR